MTVAPGWEKHYQVWTPTPGWYEGLRYAVTCSWCNWDSGANLLDVIDEHAREHLSECDAHLRQCLECSAVPLNLALRFMRSA